jgi:hypothetical protein
MRYSEVRTVVLWSALVLGAVMMAVQPAPAVDLPDSPDGTVKAVLQSLADRHPEVLWQVLPASYQQDMTDLAHLFADKMDPEIWHTAFRLGNKAVGVLRDKKQYILESSLMTASGDRRAQVESNWDTAVAALDTLFSSEISDLDNLGNIDWERYLRTTGAEIMNSAADISAAANGEEADEDVIAMLRQTTVELVSRDGDRAMVRISVPDEDPEDLALTLVEGRWVPTDMAKDWDTTIADAKQNIAGLSEEEMAENKMQVIMFFGMADAVLDQLAAVNSTEEFEQAIRDISASVPGMGGGMQ